ncbi:MAG: hypothetical protein IIB44_00175 [Candidatus Marinimicrobia bacterium]|nr:hypothetical protein [Candidatus Neomarinimicrobiota bacterium]MCH8067665.1 hypothetical protein [Candidatus Neomarinimicrobiota bacterium]
MLAALTLIVLTLYFWRRKKPVLLLAFPMIFIMVVTLVSFIIKLSDFLGNNNVLFVINCILMILIVWMIVEGVLAVQRIRSSLIPGKYEKQII